LWKEARAEMAKRTQVTQTAEAISAKRTRARGEQRIACWLNATEVGAAHDGSRTNPSGLDLERSTDGGKVVADSIVVYNEPDFSLSLVAQEWMDSVSLMPGCNDPGKTNPSAPR
jgi:hypothetical protein